MSKAQGLLVAGTSSDAGKSLVTSALCRALARHGIKVAPFKAQNMSNNSMVVPGPDGTGAEISRAQWVQALAARAEPETAMNPVLLKPSSDRGSHVVLRGRPFGRLAAGEFAGTRAVLAEVRTPLSQSCVPATTWWSARARAASQRSTCVPTTTSTWDLPAPPTCLSS